MKTFLSSLLLCVSLCVNAQVKWLSFDEATKRNRKEPRKILIDIYTDWCGWCKVMDKKTFANPIIANYINKNYYPIKFNAETPKTLVMKGRLYHFIEQGGNGYHQLAYQLLDGKMGYPSTVFLDENFNKIQNIGGYLEPKVMEEIINYFGNNYHKKGSVNQFRKQFKSKL